MAVDINNVEIIEYLVGSGADVDATDVYAWTPLLRAIDKGKKEAVELLIEKGADVNHPDGQYLFFAGHKSGVWDIYWVDAKIIVQRTPMEKD